jgi:hypothetical protein
MLVFFLHAPRGPFYSPKAARSRWRPTRKAILAFCRVAHRTITVDGPVPISFLFWRRRPLQLRASWRTGQSGAPLPTVGEGHASPADCAANRCAGDRWLTGQSGAPLDSPVNYSRTPPIFPESSLFTGDQPGAPDTVRCTTGQSGVPGRAGLRL